MSAQLGMASSHILASVFSVAMPESPAGHALQAPSIANAESLWQYHYHHRAAGGAISPASLLAQAPSLRCLVTADKRSNCSSSQIKEIPDKGASGTDAPPLRLVSIEYPAVAFKLPLFASAADRRTFLAGYQEQGLANMSKACVAARRNTASTPDGFELFSTATHAAATYEPNQREAFLLCAPQFRTGAFAVAHDATLTAGLLYPDAFNAKMGAGLGDQCTNGKASFEELADKISGYLTRGQLKADVATSEEEPDVVAAAQAGPTRSSIFADGSAWSNSFAHVLRDGLPKLLQVELFGWDSVNRVALHGRNMDALTAHLRNASAARAGGRQGRVHELSADELTCSLPASTLAGVDLHAVAQRAKDLRFSLDAAVVGNSSSGRTRIEYMHKLGKCARGGTRYMTMRRGYLCNMSPEYHPLLSGAVRDRLDAVPAAMPSKLDRIVWFTRGEFRSTALAASKAAKQTAARNGAANKGRMISDPMALREALQSVADEHGLQLEVVEKPPAYTVSELREWWGGVRLLVGAHGSAMYNGGFFMAPRRSDVVEIMNSNQARGGKASSWLFAASHDVRFSRVYGEPSNPKLDGWAANITLDGPKLVEHVKRLLDNPPAEATNKGYELLDDSPPVSSSYYSTVISPEAFQRFMGWIK